MPNRIDLTDVVFNGDPYGDFDRGGGGFNPDSLSSSSNTPTDSENLITKESGNWVVKTFSKVWDYIKGKLGISSSGSASKYLNEQGTFTTIPEIDEDTTPTTISYAPTITVDNALGVNAEDVKVKIEPVQDLHGYDKPWVGGAGKNLLPNSATSQTINGVTFTVNDDGTVKVNGTATADTYYSIATNADNLVLNSGSTYIFGGATNSDSTIGNSDNVLLLTNVNGISTWIPSYGTLATRTFTITQTSTIRCSIYVKSGTTVSNIVFKPMIRNATISDATYEPYSNICPITGWDEVNVTRSGKNSYSGNKRNITATLNGLTVVFDENGNPTVNGTATGITWIGFNSPSSQVFNIPSGNYIFNGIEGGSSSTYHLQLVDRGVDDTTDVKAYVAYGGDVAVKIDNTHKYRLQIVVRNGQTLSNKKFYPMIRPASITDPAYTPYQGNTYTIDLNGTRYGGTLDVTSGELTLTHGYADLGDLNWGYTSRESRFYASLSDIKSYGYGDVANIICSCYKTTSWNKSSNNSIFSASGYVSVKDSRYTDATQFKTAVTGQKLVYELAIPQTIQLTPTQIKMLQRNNTLFADSGDSQLSYYVNTLGNIGGALDTLDAGVVKDVSINGNNLRVNKNGTNTDLTIPYATNAGKVNNHTVDKDVPSNALFTDNNTTYTLSVDGNNIKLTPSSGSANTITVPYATTAGKATTALIKQQTGNSTNDGNLGYFTGGGQYTWCKIATIKITGTYMNYPMTFELNGRGMGLHHVEVMFNSINGTDPTLSFIRCDIDLEDNYYVKKSTTSTWELYGKLVESYGNLHLLRFNCGATAGYTLTINMTGASAPSGGTYAESYPRIMQYWYEGTGNIETELASKNQVMNFTMVTTNPSNTGELVNVTHGYHLFFIRHTAFLQRNNTIIEEAYAFDTGQLVATRMKNWWNNAWTSWQPLSFAQNLSDTITRKVTIPTGKNFQYGLCRSGNTINFKLWFDFEVAANTILLTIPTEYLPFNLQWVYPYKTYFYKEGTGEFKRLELDKDGNLKTIDSLSNGWNTFEKVWICKR